MSIWRIITICCRSAECPPVGVEFRAALAAHLIRTNKKTKKKTVSFIHLSSGNFLITSTDDIAGHTESFAVTQGTGEQKYYYFALSL